MSEIFKYQANRDFKSFFLDFDDVRLHVQQWGESEKTPLILLHGFMDCAASWQFFADVWQEDRALLALDWRGFGKSSHDAGNYYAPNYLLDLERFLEKISPHDPVILVGHSMGGMIANLYAGIRPERVRACVSIEGFGLLDRSPEDAPSHYAKWLKSYQEHKPPRPIELSTLARKLLQRNPKLAPEKAAWLAEHLSFVRDGERYFHADAKHRLPNPVLYRLAEARACWRKITAPVLWIYGEGASDHPAVHAIWQDFAARTACFADFQAAKIDECGHMIHWEKPQALSQILADFLKNQP